MLVLPVFFAIEAAEILLRSNEDGVEHSRACQSARGQLLQSHTEGQHGDQRRDADRDAHRRQSIAQLGLPQVANGQLEKVIALHASASCDSNLPSPRKISR